MKNTLDLESNVSVSATVRIENGDTVIECKNKLTGWAMAHFIGMIAGHGQSGSYQAMQNYRWNGVVYNFCVMGTDTTHPTLYNTTALSSPIGTSPGTKPQAMNCNVSVSSDGLDYYTNFLFSYPAGVLSGIVGEIGIYWQTYTNFLAGNANVDNTPGLAKLMGRVSVADGEMNSFLIDSQKPLTISWSYKFSGDGKLLKTFMFHLMNASNTGYDAGDYTLMSRNWAAKSSYMVIGQNTLIGNNFLNTASLSAPINTGSGNGTAATTQTLTTSNPSNGVYKCTWNATWAAGTITAGSTLGEIGLYLYGRAQLEGFGFNAQGQGAYFSARMNVKDGHFNAVSIDSTKPLTIQWTVTMTFT